MNFDEYQQEAVKTRHVRADAVYLAAKLTIEAAEVAQPIIKDAYHDKPAAADDIAEELGDVLWYLANLADLCDMTLADIAAANIAKLRARHGETYNAAHYTGKVTA